MAGDEKRETNDAMAIRPFGLHDALHANANNVLVIGRENPLEPHTQIQTEKPFV